MYIMICYTVLSNCRRIIESVEGMIDGILGQDVSLSSPLDIAGDSVTMLVMKVCLWET